MKKIIPLFCCFFSSLFTTAQYKVELTLPNLVEETSIATVIYYLKDTTRVDIASSLKSFREIPIQVWYPAIKDDNRKRAPYMDRLDLYYNAKLIGNIFRDRFKRVNPQVFIGSKIHNSNIKYPVLLFSPGFGMSRSYYTSLYKYLVNQGYIVVAIDHTYLNKTVLEKGSAINPSNGYWDSFPATKSAKSFKEASKKLFFAYDYFNKDLNFVFSELKKINDNDPKGIFNDSFDLMNVASLGHSAGAMGTKGAMAKSNSVFKAFITYDVRLDREYLSATEWIDIPNKTNRPILMFNLEYVQQYKPIPNEKFFFNYKNNFHYVALKKMNHSSLSDLDYLRFLDQKDSIKLKNAKKNMKIIFQITTTFLNSYLKE